MELPNLSRPHYSNRPPVRLPGRAFRLCSIFQHHPLRPEYPKESLVRERFSLESPLLEPHRGKPGADSPCATFGPSTGAAAAGAPPPAPASGAPSVAAWTIVAGIGYVAPATTRDQETRPGDPEPSQPGCPRLHWSAFLSNTVQKAPSVFIDSLDRDRPCPMPSSLDHIDDYDLSERPWEEGQDQNHSRPPGTTDTTRSNFMICCSVLVSCLSVRFTGVAFMMLAESSDIDRVNVARGASGSMPSTTDYPAGRRRSGNPGIGRGLCWKTKDFCPWPPATAIWVGDRRLRGCRPVRSRHDDVQEERVSCRVKFRSRPGGLIPTIMITGNEGSRHRAYAEMLGVCDYIRKPFAMEKLVRAVEKVLGVRSRPGDLGDE